MTEYVTNANLNEYEEFIKEHPKGHFMQSYEWGCVKKGWKWEAVISRAGDGSIRGSLAVLIRRVGPFSIMYAGRAPVCDVHDKEVLYELFDGVKTLAKRHFAYTLKIDPDIESSDVEFFRLMREYGFTLLESGAEFDAVQPKYVFRLYLEGRSLEEIVEAYSAKTRYNLRLAERKGVTVTIENKKGLDAFSDLMLTTGIRDGFVTRPRAYFGRMLDCLGDHARLYIAWFEGKAVAGSLAILFGDKVWYLYGASANEYRNVMPNYLLQTEMIRWAAENNCRLYDFRGVPGDVGEDHPLYGLVRFKKGFNGTYTEFVGEFEYHFHPFINRMMTGAIGCYRKVRTRLLLKANRKKAESGQNT
jgi:lipid II:glycine glycyltransferase (peptidoglycan interpeptide bridge formation enzyme)